MNPHLLQLVQSVATAPPALVAAAAGRLLARAEQGAVGTDEGIASLLPESQRDDMLELMRLTRKSHGEDGWARVAWGLRAASDAIQLARTKQQVELVWSGPPIVQSVFRRTDMVWVDLVAEAKREVWLASFSCGSVGEVERALLGALSRGVTVHCLFERSSDCEGYLGVEGFRKLDDRLLRKGAFYRWPGDRRERDPQDRPGLMHAKALVVDRASMFVSSANLSDAALSRNIEVGVVVRGGVQPRWLAERFEALVATRIIEPFDPTQE
jgi:phosphatidylserine/phosphatidylglycerophosphate/cardiolipin synthase-like enzyme